MTEAKKQDLPWITDCVPTMKDADYDGDVITYRNDDGDESWVCTYWQDVALGDPWLAFSPPLKPENQQTTTKLKELPWITDELPTAKDANPIGCVAVYLGLDNKSVSMHWSCVKKGMKWLPDYMGVVAERIARQESQPESKLARKFVSIAANTLGSGDFYVLYAVADDGTAWRYEAWRHEDKRVAALRSRVWKQLPALPDRDAKLT